MAGRKSRPVLYEIVRSQDRARQKSWFKRPETARKESPPKSAPQSTPPPKPQTPPPPAAPTPPANTPAYTQTSRPPSPGMIRLAGGRLHLTLGWPSLTVLLFGVIFILVVTFQAGIRYAQQLPPTIDGSEETPAQLAAETEPPTESSTDWAAHRYRNPAHVAAPTADDNPSQNTPATPDANPTRSQTPQPPAFSFKDGYHYVIIQFFPKSKLDDARQAAEFLQSQGVPCVIQDAKRDIRLIAREPFLIDQEDRAASRAEKQRAETLKKRIRELGKEYMRSGGRYLFSQPAERKF